MGKLCGETPGRRFNDGRGEVRHGWELGRCIACLLSPRATPDTHPKGRDAFLRGSVHEWPGSRSNGFGACPSLLAGDPRSAAVERIVSNTTIASSAPGGSIRPDRAPFLRCPVGPCPDAGQAKKRGGPARCRPAPEDYSFGVWGRAWIRRWWNFSRLASAMAS